LPLIASVPSVPSLLEAAHAPFALLILMVIAIAAVIFADASLAMLAVVPSFVGSLAALVVTSPSDGSWMVVSLGALGTTIWLVRRYPRPAQGDPRPLVPIAATAGVACVSVMAMLAGVSPATSTSIVVGGLAAALAQILVAASLRWLFHRPWIDLDAVAPGSDAHRRAVEDRYAHLSPTIRYWVRGKLRLDPLFTHLGLHAPTHGRLLDVGCGYALPAVWLAALRPELHIDAFDALSQRVRIARHVLDHRGRVAREDVNDWADGDPGDDPYDGALCIDVLHHLPRPAACLRAIALRLREDGVLLLRTTVHSRETENESRSLVVERIMVRLRGQKTVRFYEEEEVRRLLTEAGFGSIEIERPADGRVETLFVARK
jgi:uncharacterized protein